MNRIKYLFKDDKEGLDVKHYAAHVLTDFLRTLCFFLITKKMGKVFYD